jgi:hypothetical protein
MIMEIMILITFSNCQIFSFQKVWRYLSIYLFWYSLRAPSQTNWLSILNKLIIQDLGSSWLDPSTSSQLSFTRMEC